MNDKTLERRKFLKTSISSLGLIALGSPMARALASSCGLTPPQTRGPFYPGEQEFKDNTDLTRVEGRDGSAVGQVVLLSGKVLDQFCRPIEGANVEIWQACASGRYNNSRDPNAAPLDPNFRYWAEVFTGADGGYRFKTIIPGSYPASDSWTRPPHIHFRISCLGYRELITQMYFKGNPLNQGDLILQDLAPAERQNVIVEFLPSPFVESGVLGGEFNITLQSLQG